ncbi:DUF389 domain-containing protein [Enterococcus casseliflavus]|uniref:DUF389 domain-containing protein n=1 Tax=Enterococcus casseliflavus TaxID=37734 RepID=UPI0022E02935|nr:DUF389 domain-containing protein [Enterococcus casseliflavus]
MNVNLTPDLVSKEQLIGKIQKDMDQTMLVYALLVCATLIASIGLNYNSTTTIIGAMLISPLLNGINGIGFGLGLSHLRLVKKGLLVFSIQVIIVLIISFAFFLLTPVKDTTPEIITQTSATIWDICVALIGGSALAFAKVRGRDNDVIIGVSIGTSLILPLCVTGYGLSIKDYSISWESAQLFFTNSFLICFSLFITIWLLQYGDFRHQKWWKFAVVALPITVIGSFFVYTTIQTTIVEYHAKRFVEAKLGEHYLLEQTLNEQKQSLELKLVGEPLSKQAVAQLEASLKNYALPDYQLKVNVYSANKEGQFDAKVLAEILQVQNQGTSKFLGLD